MKKLGIIVCCIFMFLLGACSVGMVSAEQTWPLKIWAQNDNGVLKTWNLKDEETGVEYIVVSTYSYRGGTCITPRLNADGTLYTGD